MIQFFRCEACGNIITFIKQGSNKVSCCNKEMQELIPKKEENQTGEKHIPVITNCGNIVHVRVGMEAHPMKDTHYIQWIVLETNKGMQFKMLSNNGKNEAVFKLLCEEKPLYAYAYCNLHGLWIGK